MPHVEASLLHLSQPEMPTGRQVFMEGKGGAAKTRHEGQGSEVAFPGTMMRCGDFPQSAFRLWVKRPGQDLNLRGVTQRFSRPPPYRTRRPGQRRLQRTTFGISVPPNSDKNAYDGIGFRPMGCESSRRSCPHARNRKCSSVRGRPAPISSERSDSLPMHTSSSEETPRSPSMNDWSMAITFASSRSSLEAPRNDR